MSVGNAASLFVLDLLDDGPEHRERIIDGRMLRIDRAKEGTAGLLDEDLEDDRVFSVAVELRDDLLSVDRR